MSNPKNAYIPEIIQIDTDSTCRRCGWARPPEENDPFNQMRYRDRYEYHTVEDCMNHTRNELLKTQVEVAKLSMALKTLTDRFDYEHYSDGGHEPDHSYD
jgi:hypothetical protein